MHFDLYQGLMIIDHGGYQVVTRFPVGINHVIFISLHNYMYICTCKQETYVEYRFRSHLPIAMFEKRFLIEEEGQLFLQSYTV